MSPPEPPRRRLPSAPDLPRAIAGDEQPERRAVRNHPGVEGAEQPAPKRSPTLTAMPAPPALPLEHARTVPAAAHHARTVRVASPVAVQVVNPADAPYGQPAATTLPPPSLDPRDAQIAALIRERDAKSKESAPPDRGAWAKLGYRVAAAAATAAVLVITALGARAVSMVETKAEAAKAAQRKTTQDVDARDVEWQTWARRVVAIEECRQEQQGQALERLLPPKDKLIASRPLSPWVDGCPSLPKPP